MSTRAGRDLGSVSNKVNNYTTNQKYAQQILSVTAAVISILAGLLTFFWFIQMKRNFRHHLIMLLIASQMFKAFWYLVPPIAILIYGRPMSQTACQATGFLLAAQVEASDFIILLIAVHTALSIQRSGKITLQSGLFPYRYQVYACFIALSLLLPSLAFVNQDHDAYVSQGTFCTLPVRPFWYRLALSWIPRYLILIVILGVYMTIYVYTRRTFGSFDGKFSSGSTISRDIGTPKSSRKSQEMPFPSDLGISPCARDSGTPSTCKPSLGPGIAHRRPRMSYFPSWIRYSFSQSTPIPSVSSETRAPNASPTKLTPILSPQSQQRQSETFSRTAFRTPTLAEALHDPDLLIKKVRKPSPDPNNTLQKRHQAIQRQLRKIFIYPLVYLLMWIPAFINHCYFYTKSHDPPYILSCVSLTCLCLQCAVDCLIFSIREKPWRCKAEAEKAERGRQILDQGRDIEMGPVTSEGEAGTITTCGQGIGRHSRNVSERLNGQSPRQERHWWDEDRVRTPLENTSIHGNE